MFNQKLLLEQILHKVEKQMSPEMILKALKEDKQMKKLFFLVILLGNLIINIFTLSIYHFIFN